MWSHVNCQQVTISVLVIRVRRVNSLFGCVNPNRQLFVFFGVVIEQINWILRSSVWMMVKFLELRLPITFWTLVPSPNHGCLFLCVLHTNRNELGFPVTFGASFNFFSGLKRSIPSSTSHDPLRLAFSLSLSCLHIRARQTSYVVVASGKRRLKRQHTRFRE